MSKVVYLLGAGASFGTRENGVGSPILTGLPIVREIEGELENMTNLLASIPLNDKELEESKQNLIGDFLKLKEACGFTTEGLQVKPLKYYSEEILSWSREDERRFIRNTMLK